MLPVVVIVAVCPSTKLPTVTSASLLVNGDAEENKNPVQELEESEDVQVVKVPVDEIENFLLEKANNNEVVEARLFTMCCSNYISKI